MFDGTSPADVTAERLKKIPGLDVMPTPDRKDMQYAIYFDEAGFVGYVTHEGDLELEQSPPMAAYLQLMKYLNEDGIPHQERINHDYDLGIGMPTIPADGSLRSYPKNCSDRGIDAPRKPDGVALIEMGSIDS